MNATTENTTETVYIGKGRYGTNYKGHAIATYTPAERTTPGQGAYVYTVTITDIDGTETTLPEPVEAIHAEAVAVKAWEERNAPAAPEEPAAVEFAVNSNLHGLVNVYPTRKQAETAAAAYDARNAGYCAVTETPAVPNRPITYRGGGCWMIPGKGMIVQGITQAWTAYDMENNRVTINGHSEWGGPQQPAEIAAMVDWN